MHSKDTLKCEKPRLTDAVRQWNRSLQPRVAVSQAGTLHYALTTPELVSFITRGRTQSVTQHTINVAYTVCHANHNQPTKCGRTQSVTQHTINVQNVAVHSQSHKTQLTYKMWPYTVCHITHN